MSDTQDWPSLDSQVPSVYSGDGWCPEGGWLDVAVDQWWVVTVECEHGKWCGVSDGLGDPGRGLQRALHHAKTTHQCDVTRIPAEQFDRLLESDEPEPSPALQRAVQQYHAHQCGEKK